MAKEAKDAEPVIDRDDDDAASSHGRAVGPRGDRAFVPAWLPSDAKKHAEIIVGLEQRHAKGAEGVTG